MARPKKIGLDYFPHDVDASHDEKMEAMEAIHGLRGYAFFFKLLERIYRAGGELRVDHEIEMILMNSIFRSKQDVSDVETIPETYQKLLSTALSRGLFDRQRWESDHVLTSDGIKKRCQVVVQKRQKMAELYENRVSAVETQQKPLQKPDKGKERKGKERKENTDSAPPAPKKATELLIAKETYPRYCAAYLRVYQNPCPHKETTWASAVARLGAARRTNEAIGQAINGWSWQPWVAGDPAYGTPQWVVGGRPVKGGGWEDNFQKNVEAYERLKPEETNAT